MVGGRSSSSSSQSSSPIPNTTSSVSNGHDLLTPCSTNESRGGGQDGSLNNKVTLGTSTMPQQCSSLILNPENNNQILVTLQEKRLIQEFSHLQEKSKQLFNQLRDLPPHFSTLGGAINAHHQPNGLRCSESGGGAIGSAAAALSCQQAYFSRAFDIFTKLWKFQQLHRLTLDKKYGLKRWQIGDIASKIGQLYYHYYVRTSELAYLQEALSFYGAIRARGYYANRSVGACGRRRESAHSGRSAESSHNNSTAESGLIVKKLRYYARFIVVSLLLRKNNLKDLLRELSLHVENYVATVDDEPEEQLEWNLVLSEIRGFIDADSPVVVYDNSTEKLVDPLDQVLILSHRLPAEMLPKNYRPIEDLLSSSKETYKLHEILIIGNKSEQLKFSEFTVDMFRMTQTFERSHFIEENTSNVTRNVLSLGHLGGTCPGGQPLSSSTMNKNPHKYLLYRAAIEQILVTLNAAWSDLPWNGLLLVYLSADPSASNKGLATTNKPFKSKHYNEIRHQEDEGKEINCLYPCDLVPLTRKPLFVIVDSENSHIFRELGTSGEDEGFGQPLIILMSPESRPEGMCQRSGGGGISGHGMQMSSSRGSLFSLFLHCPLAGLCQLCGVKSLTLTTWNELEHLLNIFFCEAFEAIGSQGLGGGDHNWAVYLKLLGDDFLRLIILRFLFCQLLFQMHKDFQEPKVRPICYPEVSLMGCGSSLETSRFEELVFEMTDLIQSKHLFNQI